MTDQTDIFDNNQEQEDSYEEALHLMETGRQMLKPSMKREKLLQAAALFETAGQYKDAPQQKECCEEAAEKVLGEEREVRYEAARARLTNPDYRDYGKLAKDLEELGDYRDSRQLHSECLARIEKDRKKRRNGRVVRLVILGVLAAGVIWTLASGYFHVIMGAAYERAGMGSYALASYRKLDGRFDGEARYAACEMRQLKKAAIGSTVTFGNYKWKLLERKKKKKTALLIATDINEESDFYGVAFHDSPGVASWESCSLRTWLNTQVYENGFTPEERDMILPLAREASENPDYGTMYAATTDYLAPMSVQEQARYQETAGGSGGDGWIRTPGASDDTVSFITSMNTVRLYGLPADEKLSVRPVIMIDLSAV